MTRYEVYNNLGIDCSTEDTGDEAGIYNGYPYWSWINNVGAWYLFPSVVRGVLKHWRISSTLNGVPIAASPDTTIINDYTWTGNNKTVNFFTPNSKYKISGNTEPNCNIINTGLSFGIFNKKRYWKWTNSIGIFYLWWTTNRWTITKDNGEGIPSLEQYYNGTWYGLRYDEYGDLAYNINQTYLPGGNNSGNPIITEHFLPIQKITNEDNNIKNGSMVIKTGESGGINLISKSLYSDINKLVISDIQDKLDNRYNNNIYYWGGIKNE